MSYTRTLGFASALLLQAPASYAESIDQDFQRCVSTALEQRGQTAKAITINTGAMSRSELDHDASRPSTSYRMRLNSKSTGEDIRTVNCKISYSGNLLAVSLDH